MRNYSILTIGIIFTGFTHVFGQAPTVDTYLSGYTDGTNVIVQGTMHTNGWKSFPGSATHTYSQSLTLTSPSHRTKTCGFSIPVQAQSPFQNTCEVEVGVDDDYGPWIIDGYQRANCSIVGAFANDSINVSQPLQHIQAYYKYTGGNLTGSTKGIFKRCNPIGTICDTCIIQLYGTAWPFGLYDGWEFDGKLFNGCLMVPFDETDKCYSPDPIPGVFGGGVGQNKPEQKEDLGILASLNEGHKLEGNHCRIPMGTLP